MAGIANDYLIYPILDLIREEIRKSSVTNVVGGDPFAGTPSVTLWRDHPVDPDRVTGAALAYESGYRNEIYMMFGANDPRSIPPEITVEHPDYDYYMNYRLTKVSIVSLTPDRTPLVTYVISLNYDDSGLLTGTTVNRI